MRLRIVALGHRMPAWVNQAVADYTKRLPREFAFELVELKPAPRDRGRTIPQLLADEARRIFVSCEGARIVALDEHGTAWTTHTLAGRVDRWRGEGADVAFVIGSADGLSPDLKRKAEAILSVSAMTLPHGLVRVMLAEQLYRAASLAAGHPYHRE